MKRFSILITLMCIGIAVLGAQPKDKIPYVQNEIAAIEKEIGGTTIGALTIADLDKIAGRISIAKQKEDFVQRSAVASMIMPGIGQFMNKDPLAGSLFIGADVILLAGTLVGGYFLLPANVQFDKLDYFNDSFTIIKDTWHSNNLVSYLPSIVVFAGGMILSMIVRHFSAENAANLAAKNIADGKITFEPDFSFYGSMPGFGMRMRF
jgi:hypothetical protein